MMCCAIPCSAARVLRRAPATAAASPRRALPCPTPTPAHRPHPRPCCRRSGYDASAHLTEETKDAGTSGPRGIVMTVVVSFFVGWAYLFSLTFSIQARSWGGLFYSTLAARCAARPRVRSAAAAPARLPEQNTSA